MYEVEIKSSLDNVDDIKQKLNELNAQYITTINQIDYYYNHPVRDFKETDEVVRIRKSNDEIFFTYKGPKEDLKTKTRQEIEFKIESLDKARLFLEKLGFKYVTVIEKKREKYCIDDVTICIDVVKGLGYFIEFEKISNDKSNAEKQLFRLAKSLGIDEFITKSYMDLLFELND